MEQFNAENHLEYSFDFIIHKSPQAAAAQNCCANNVSVWNFNVSRGVTD